MGGGNGAGEEVVGLRVWGWAWGLGGCGETGPHQDGGVWGYTLVEDDRSDFTKLRPLPEWTGEEGHRRAEEAGHERRLLPLPHRG